MNLAADRVRARTASDVLRRIDDVTNDSLNRHAEAGAGEIAARISELDREWDTDRVLETEAALMGLTGLALGTLVRPQLLALPALVAASVLCHALTGRYPLMPLFRRLGFRTAREIARERYALKALGGDFAGLGATDEAPASAARPPRPSSAQPGFH